MLIFLRSSDLLYPSTENTLLRCYAFTFQKRFIYESVVYKWNKIKLMFSFNYNSLLFTQFRVPLFTTWCKQQQFFLCLLFLIFWVLCINNNNSEAIMRQIFVTCLHTNLTELLLTHSSALPCFLHAKGNSLSNVLEGKCSWLRLLDVYINVNIIHHCFCVFCLCLFLQCCWYIFVYLFTIFYAGVCCYIIYCYIIYCFYLHFSFF